MAKSVLTFKEAGRANIRLQAQSVEKDKQSAAARAAAAAKVMEEFDAAVGDIVKAAMAGDFSRRVALEGKDGVILNVASAMNTMCENFSQVMDDLSDMLAALAEGNLTRRINADYHGMFGILKDNANTTAESVIGDDLRNQGCGATRSPTPRRKFRPAPPTCRSAPRNRRRAWRKPPPRWKKSPPP